MHRAPASILDVYAAPSPCAAGIKPRLTAAKTLKPMGILSPFRRRQRREEKGKKQNKGAEEENKGEEKGPPLPEPFTEPVPVS